MIKSIFVFVGAIALLLCFFYFYEVELFQAQITSKGDSFIQEVSFSEFFIERTDLEDYSTKPTTQGWLLLATIFFGLPMMLAYRVTLKRYPRRAAKPEN